MLPALQAILSKALTMLVLPEKRMPSCRRYALQACQLSAVGLLNRRNKLIGILAVVLFFMILGSLPSWPHARKWGYYPSAGLGLALLIVIILLVTGRI